MPLSGVVLRFSQASEQRPHTAAVVRVVPRRQEVAELAAGELHANRRQAPVDPLADQQRAVLPLERLPQSEDVRGDALGERV